MAKTAATSTITTRSQVGARRASCQMAERTASRSISFSFVSRTFEFHTGTHSVIAALGSFNCDDVAERESWRQTCPAKLLAAWRERTSRRTLGAFGTRPRLRLRSHFVPVFKTPTSFVSAKTAELHKRSRPQRVIQTSTRRFLARPGSSSLQATGAT